MTLRGELNDQRIEMKKNTTYEERKANGICPYCGREKAVPGYIMCKKCREQNKERCKKRYDRAKDKGLCTRCYKKPSIEGQTMCRECLAKMLAKDKEKRYGGVCDMDCFNCKYDDCINDNVTECYADLPFEEKEKIQKRNRTRYHELKERGICVKCGKLPAKEGITLCESCAHKRSKREKRKRAENQQISKRDLWREQRKCYFCGGECVQGKKVCTKHYEMLKAMAMHMRESERSIIARERLKKVYFAGRQQ